MLWTMQFWKGAAERALKTLVQVLAAAFVVGVPVNAVDIRGALLLAATAVVASLCTSILSADFVAGPPDGAVHPFHVVMGAPDDGERTATKDLNRSYTLDVTPTGDAVEPEGDKLSPAARRAAKIARARGEL